MFDTTPGSELGRESKMKLAKRNGCYYPQPQRAPCGSTCVGADTARVAASSIHSLWPVFLLNHALPGKARSNNSLKPKLAVRTGPRSSNQVILTSNATVSEFGLALIRSTARNHA